MRALTGCASPEVEARIRYQAREVLRIARLSVRRARVYLEFARRAMTEHRRRQMLLRAGAALRFARNRRQEARILRSLLAYPETP